MDKKSKLLIKILILVVIISIIFTYKKSFIDMNYQIIQEDYFI